MKALAGWVWLVTIILFSYKTRFPSPRFCVRTEIRREEDGCQSACFLKKVGMSRLPALLDEKKSLCSIFKSFASFFIR